MTEVKDKAAPAAKDNNRRLAALESGVSALAIALTANGFALEAGSDPIETAIVAIKGQAAKIDELAAANEAAGFAAEKDAKDLHELAGFASGTLGRLAPDLELAPLTDEAPLAYLERLTAAAEPRIAELLSQAGTPGTDAAELEELRRQVAELKQDNDDLQTDLTDVTNAKNDLANQLADAGNGTAPAAPAPIVEEAADELPEIERSANARDVGAAFGELADVAIARILEDGGQFEIAFSNGDFELVEFSTPPIRISAAELVRVDSGRYMVKPPISIRGVGAPVKVHGAGLLYQDEQIGYCAFEPAVIVNPGQERRFDRALIFG